jgi:phosphate transport system substrate-binding protein
VAATSENVRNGNYPMSRPLTLVTKELPAGLVKAFLEFALSSQVSDLVKEFSFVPYVD